MFYKYVLPFVGNSITTNPQQWGAYTPNSSTFFYRAIVKYGLSRGAVCKWIRREWKKKHPTIVDVTVRGVKYRLDISRNTTDGKILTSSKFYDKKEINALCESDNKSLGVFIDIGANTGYYSLTLAKRGFSKIVAIEPNPPTLELLRYNVGINDLQNKICIIPVCVGNSGEFPLYCSGGLGKASLIGNPKDTSAIMVKSVPLLEILVTNNIKEITSMKIDVEGCEDKALIPFFENADISFWPKTMVIEDCHQDMWGTDLIGYLKGIGYQVFGKTRGNLIMERA